MEDYKKIEKIELRRQLRMVRNSIPADEREVWDRAMEKTLLGRGEFEGACTVFGYQSRGSEVSTAGMLGECLRMGKTVLVPSAHNGHLPEDGIYRLGEDRGVLSTELVEGAELRDIDLVLVPGLAWDRDGYRTGFGGGYFDRLIAGLREDCVKVGLAYECQVIKNVPREPWDMKVDWLLTQDGFHRCW